MTKFLSIASVSVLAIQLIVAMSAVSATSAMAQWSAPLPTLSFPTADANFGCSAKANCSGKPQVTRNQ
ncbi:MAG: hypothetical protein AAGK03_13190 [Pseudomonadota bacterium]